MSNNSKTDVLIAHNICRCSQCDSKQTAFLVASVLVSVSLSQIDIAPSVCACVHTHMCGFGPSDTKLAQGLLCHISPQPEGLLFHHRAGMLSETSSWRLQARGPAISQTRGLASPHHAGMRRGSEVPVERIVAPVCSLMGPDSSL